MPRAPMKAQAIADSVRAKIDSGEYAPSSWLPPMAELARLHQCDLSTIRNAMKLLAADGLVELFKGQGGRVLDRGAGLSRETSDISTQVGQWRGFAVSVLAKGKEPFTDTTITELDAVEDVALRLAVPIGTRVLERARVQGVAGEPPIQLSTTYLAWEWVELVPRLLQVDTGPGGMYSRLEEIEFPLLLCEDRLVAAHADDRERELLQIDVDEPVVVVWRTSYTHHHKIIDVTRRVVVTRRSPLVYRYGPGA
ncbi:GntR family transcriptional regulator [Nonomuraea sp. NPDC050394]|uniref:GntR family transcriptional regulator n=1 Tax=Nonomuraea sp. NPDC050394 TaxID=3364363 RepID=UPI003792785B